MNLIHAVPTDALIAELVRRKRIRVLTVSAVFFNEHATDPNYVRSMESALISRVGAGLHNELCITFEDTAIARDAEGRATKTTREARLMALVPKGVDDGEDH